MPGSQTSCSSTTRRRRTSPSALDTLQGAFDLLVIGPRPLALDGRQVGHGLPKRLIPLGELKQILLRTSTGREARDAAWRELVLRARASDPAWMVGAAGVALPGLRRTAGRVAWGFRGDTTDLDAEILAGFVDALHTIDLDRPGIATRLKWSAHRAGERARHAAEGSPPCEQQLIDSYAPPYPWGHPDLVLFDAVAKGVLSANEAELIGRTRLEHLTIAEAAAELGLGVEQAKKMRQRCEGRVQRAIRRGQVESTFLSPQRPGTGLGVQRGAPQAASGRNRSPVSPDRPDPITTFSKGGDGPGPARKPTTAQRREEAA